MTMIVGIIALLLVCGIVGAFVKGLFRVAVTLGILMLLVVGAAIFVISGMR